MIDGADLRRSNSISDAPEDDIPLRITVKRVRDGLVSNHVNDRLAADDAVEVMPPFGGFCPTTLESLSVPMSRGYVVGLSLSSGNYHQTYPIHRRHSPMSEY